MKWYLVKKFVKYCDYYCSFSEQIFRLHKEKLFCRLSWIFEQSVKGYTCKANFHFSFGKVQAIFGWLFFFLEFSRHSDKSHCYSVDMGTVFIYGSILKIALLHNVVCSEAIVLKVSTYTHLLEHRCLKSLCINCPTFSWSVQILWINVVAMQNKYRQALPKFANERQGHHSRLAFCLRPILITFKFCLE